MSVLSVEFAEFAGQAGYVVGSRDGVEAVWNRGGEIRFFIRTGRGIVLNRAERAAAPRSVLATGEGEIVERYLTAVIGATLRSRAEIDLLLFRRAVGSQEPASGWATRPRDIGGYEIVDRRGALIPVVFAASYDALGYTFYADAPLAVMRESFRHPEGEPLLHEAWQRWRDRVPPTI